MMRSLRERLAQFETATRTVRSESDGAIARRRSSAMQSLLDLGAEWVGDPPHGYLRLVEEVELPDRGQLPNSFWERTGMPRPTRPGGWGILDTETTGLESGTGTVVFLVALLRWEDERSQLLQFFLPEPQGESSFWTDVGIEVQQCAILLSYNGKSFDLPRMKTRMRLARVESDCLDRPHADLLHPTRNLTRDWLPNSRLAEVEHRLLGIERNDDLPGGEAPSVYRALQVDAVDAGLAEVMRHNRDDVLHLVDLTLFLSDVYAGEGWRQLPPAARFALARAVARRGNEDFALLVLSTLREVAPADLCAVAGRFAGALRGRRGELDEAEKELLRALAAAPSALDTRVQLAKLYEHRLRDLRRARELVRESLGVAARRRGWGDRAESGECSHRAWAHRLQRLNRKIDRKHGRN